MKYDCNEDTLLEHVISQMKSKHDFSWPYITRVMNSNANPYRKRTYTESMLRNRHQRIAAGVRAAIAKNRCKLCGSTQRGHICGVPDPTIQWVADNILSGREPTTETDEGKDTFVFTLEELDFAFNQEPYVWGNQKDIDNWFSLF